MHSLAINWIFVHFSMTRELGKEGRRYEGTDLVGKQDSKRKKKGKERQVKGKEEEMKTKLTDLIC